MDRGIQVHMKNEVDDVADQFDTWQQEWGACAMSAKFVVCFNDEEYRASQACMMEYNFCKENSISVMEIPDYSEKNPSAANMADEIYNRLRQMQRGGRSY
mmetsp:Transcript_38265/g.100951  ORF Transcript_38265/g.100951 Transcript_38265/m.100951 type:complete len:100 (+) Transcript_38265:579-878(+)